MNANCPVCDEEINFEQEEELIVGQKVVCPSCSTDLEVTELSEEDNSVVLEEAPEVEEDWGE